EESERWEDTTRRRGRGFRKEAAVRTCGRQQKLPTAVQIAPPSATGLQGWAKRSGDLAAVTVLLRLGRVTASASPAMRPVRLARGVLLPRLPRTRVGPIVLPRLLRTGVGPIVSRLRAIHLGPLITVRPGRVHFPGLRTVGPVLDHRRPRIGTLRGPGDRPLVRPVVGPLIRSIVRPVVRSRLDLVPAHLARGYRLRSDSDLVAALLTAGYRLHVRAASVVGPLIVASIPADSRPNSGVVTNRDVDRAKLRRGRTEDPELISGDPRRSAAVHFRNPEARDPASGRPLDVVDRDTAVDHPVVDHGVVRHVARPTPEILIPRPGKGVAPDPRLQEPALGDEDVVTRLNHGAQGEPTEADTDVVVEPDRRRQGSPTDVAASVLPRDPGRSPDRAGNPDPAVARIEGPAAIVIGRPAERLIRRPGPAVVAVNPTAVGIRAPIGSRVPRAPGRAVL